MKMDKKFDKKIFTMHNNKHTTMRNWVFPTQIKLLHAKMLFTPQDTRQDFQMTANFVQISGAISLQSAVIALPTQVELKSPTSEEEGQKRHPIRVDVCDFNDEINNGEESRD